MTRMDLVLLFLAATSLYTGLLTLSQNVAAAILCLSVGILLGARPVLRLLRAAQFEWKLQGMRRTGGKPGGQKSHLRVVKPKEKKEKPPTYH